METDMKLEVAEKEEEIHRVSKSHKRRTLRTIAAFLMFFGLGLTSAVHGPTLVNMKELLHTDTVHLSLAMSMLSIGYLLGAVICGILFHRLDSELQFSLACLLMSLSLIGAPWSRDVYGYMSACFFTGLGMAYIDTGGNAIVLMLWCGHRAKDPMLQGLHFIWSVGSTLSPFMLRPFLVNQAVWSNRTGCLNSSATENGGQLSTIINSTISLNSSEGSNVRDLSVENYNEWLGVGDNREIRPDQTDFEVCSYEVDDITLVRYAYVVVGSIVLVISLLYVAIYCLMGHHLLRRDRPSQLSNVMKHEYDLPRCFRFGLFVLVFVFYVLNLILERIGGDYLSLFVVEELGWSVKRGAVITSAYWGAHACGLLLGVLISICISPKVMIFMSITCTSVAYTALLFVHNIPNEVIFASVMLAGMGVSTVFPSMMLWVSQYLTSSSILSAVCVTGASMGTIAGYPLIGSLIEALGHKWYVYSLLAASIFAFMMIIIIHVYSLAAVRRMSQDEKINEK